MHLHFDGVNEAFKGLVKGFHNQSIPTITNDSRNGPVIRCAEPMTVSYHKPIRRILLNRFRDCNPFFHLFESLWMLAGRNDVAPLNYYNGQIKNYSDDGKTFWGAYGHRWRRWFGWDQVAGICRELKNNPESRRCVLQIWEGGPTHDVDDFWKASNGGKDVPCNVTAFFDLRKETKTSEFSGGPQIIDTQSYLDMTVCNRSNDMIWGMLGSNVVHFSVLQEYMAACIGVKVGRYNQFTNNLHVYKENWKPKLWLREYTRSMHSEPELSYNSFKNFMPLVQNSRVFDFEVPLFIDNHLDPSMNWQEPFLQKVASPMCWAFKLHKEREYNLALATMDIVEADDWRTMGKIWIEKRKRNWEKKNEKTSIDQV